MIYTNFVSNFSDINLMPRKQIYKNDQIFLIYTKSHKMRTKPISGGGL